MTTEEWIAEIYREGDEQDRRCREAASRQRFGSPEYFACLFGDEPGGTREEDAPLSAAESIKNRAPQQTSIHRGLSIQVEHGPDGRIMRKIETIGRKAEEYEYGYDADGRLVEVRRGGRLVEEYAYDGFGRRVMAHTEASGMRRTGLEYEGMRLSRCGDARYFHDLEGARSAKRDSRLGNTYYRYGSHGGLDWAKLPGNWEITWTRSPHGLPLASFENGTPVERWSWHDLLRLSRYEDLRRGVAMDFHYTEGARTPQAVTISDSRGSHVYTIGYDQVGTLKTVADEHGNLVKELLYDSFGNVVRDTNKHLHIPIGFAGGTVDRFTGLIRFGHRDYDPETGRFTAKDPLGDTGGDHDLYEYCVDDPVSAVDPEGLKKKHTYSFTKRAGEPVDETTGKAMQCFSECAGMDIVVTAGKETGHSKGSAHETGQAADVGKNSNPKLTRGTAEQCYNKCFDKNNSYAQEEHNHYHFQTRKGKGGATGFAKGQR